MFDNLRRHVKNVRNEHDVSEAKRDAVCNEQRFEHNDNIVNNVECKGLARELFERSLAREEKDMLCGEEVNHVTTQTIRPIPATVMDCS